MSISLTRESINRYELELEERYRRAKDAIQLMREMLNQGESGFPTIDPGLAGVSAAGAQHASLPPLEATTEAQSLAGKIEQVCEEFHDDRWTMRRMLKYLQQIGFDLRDKPEGSIPPLSGNWRRAANSKLFGVALAAWQASISGDPPMNPLQTRKPMTAKRRMKSRTLATANRPQSKVALSW